MIRATKRLLLRLKVEPSEARLPSSTRLGDWTASLVFFGRKPLVLLASTVTLLPVVVELAPAATLIPRFRLALHEVLLGLGVNALAADRELGEMTRVTIAKTNNRQVLGSMNDFTRMLGFELRAGDSCLGASLKLAEAPCGPLGMRSPDDATRRLLADA